MLGPVGEGNPTRLGIAVGPTVDCCLLGTQELLGVTKSGEALAAQSPAGFSPPGPIAPLELLQVAHAARLSPTRSGADDGKT